MKKNINEIEVEWDETKNKNNIKKHGISFETAALISARMATPAERKIYYGE